MPEDLTEAMRTIDALQERLDKVFNRVNADPVYATPAAIADAISDNPRYFAEDRKNELAEIFFAILDQIYDRVVHQNRTDPFCNPLFSPASGASRLPEIEMMMRAMMPLGWALDAAWAAPGLENKIDPYFQSFSDAEAQVLYDILVFLAGLFPEFKAAAGFADFIEYWRKLALDREALTDETDEDKSLLLSVLMRKKAELAARQKKS